MNQITEANFARLLATLNNDAPIAAVDFETFYSKVCSVRELGAWAYCQHPDWDCYLVAVTRKSKEGIPLPTYVGDPKLFPWAELAGYRLYSHNAMFDMTVYRRMVELGQVIDIEPLIEGWDCTADFSAYACNRRSLKDAVKFFFKRELSKKVRDDALGKRWPTDFTAEQRADMLAYGGDDSDECYSIAELAQKQWPDKERLLSRLTRLQGMRGVQLDMAKLDLMMRACRNREVELLNIIPWAKEGKPVTSPKATAEFCRANGVMPPPVKAREGEETFIKWEEAVAALAERSVTDWLAAQPTLVEGGPAPVDFLLKYVLIGAMADALPATAPWFGSTAVSEVMRALADYRSITKFAKQLETLKERSDDNGIYRFSLKYAGAHTLRFSGDAGFNMQNITKADPNNPDAFWIVTADGDDSRILHGGVIRSDVFPEFHEARKDPAVRKKIVFCAGGLKFTLLDMRSLFTARSGHKLVIADSSQIEPRCLAFLTKDRAFIELVKQGIDIYEAHARTMHGFTGPKGHLKYLANVLKDSAAMTLRARSKAERLGLGYQAGPVGYQRAAAMLAGLALSLEEALDAVRRYREANPHVTGFWARLQTALASSVGRDLRLKLPSGRFMSYRNVAEERVMVVDKETGKPKWKSQLTADIDGRRYGFYGGALCENIVQGTARDVFIEYVLALWDESLGRAMEAGLSGWAALVESLVEAPLWTVHDELICESPDNRVDAHLKEVEHVMNSTPVWAGDTPFACEGLVSPHYLK